MVCQKIESAADEVVVKEIHAENRPCHFEQEGWVVFFVFEELPGCEANWFYGTVRLLLE